MKKNLQIVMAIIFLLPLVALADECVQGDCVNGFGTMVYSTGHKFSGHFKDGLRHGKGVLLMPGGRKIVGIWDMNEIVSGTYSAPDGSRYEGQWKYRERNGRGTLTYPDGRVYTGEFKSDRRHGKGTLVYPDGRRYVGDFVNGQRTGQGTMTYPDGTKYSGGFTDGQRNGHGVLIYPDGRRLEGEFKDGRFMDP